jgi:hypothetical protein
MRDDLMGGLLATVVAAPLVILCCGGGSVVLAAVVGAVGRWLSGIDGIATLLAAAIAALTWRSLRRRSPARCALPRQCHDSRAL